MPQLDLGKVVGDTGPQGPKGDQGIQGPAGQTGPGVAVGGSANQVLVKHSGTNYDTQWVDAGNLPSIAGVQDAIAIIANGDTHAAVAAGQAVFVRSHSTLAAGLYWASSAIGTNAALSTSNLTADNQGGLNKLKGDIDSLNSNLENITTGSTITDCNTYNSLATGRIIDSTANKPNGISYGVLLNLIYRVGGYRAQIAIGVSANRFSIRYSTDGGTSWSGWAAVAFQS